MDIAVVIGAHENSPAFRDTLESVRYHWTNRVLVVVDGKGWGQFRTPGPGVPMLEGFYHGRSSQNYRNVCLGLMKAWETWGSDCQWYCYMEYDCLVGSDRTMSHLGRASQEGVWLLGNDHRTEPRRIPFFERFEKTRLDLHYMLGCCFFLGAEFMSTLSDRNFFERFLQFTNFNIDEATYLSPNGKTEPVYDVGEFLYPTLAVHYGGTIQELDCWDWERWRNGGEDYPMRFMPELHEGNYEGACVMHPLKSECEIRSFHRRRRGVDRKPAGR